MMKMMVLATMRTMQVTMLIVMLVRMLSLMPTVTKEIITAVKKMTMPTARMYRCSSCRDNGARDDGNRGGDDELKIPVPWSSVRPLTLEKD